MKKLKQLPYTSTKWYGTRTRLEWILFIQDKWDTDFISAELEFDSLLNEESFIQVTSL